MYLVKTPLLISRLTSRSLVWRISTKSKKIFLSFDDGPIPHLTMEILAYLNEYNAKATFFCVGQNAEQYPELIDRILDDGHNIGNHSYQHINGWKTSSKDYFENVKKAAKHINSNLFRPPYGRINYNQIRRLKVDYKIIMWSILSGDFDLEISPQQCLKNVLQSKEGDIVVFHDNMKAVEKIHYVLPRYLDYFTKQGYQFCSVNV